MSKASFDSLASFWAPEAAVRNCTRFWSLESDCRAGLRGATILLEREEASGNEESNGCESEWLERRFLLIGAGVQN